MQRIRFLIGLNVRPSRAKNQRCYESLSEMLMTREVMGSIEKVSAINHLAVVPTKVFLYICVHNHGVLQYSLLVHTVFCFIIFIISISYSSQHLLPRNHFSQSLTLRQKPASNQVPENISYT